MTDMQIEVPEGMSEEEVEEMRAIAQEALAQEDAQTNNVVSQAVLNHLKERLISTRIQMEMLGRKNAELEQEIANLKNQLAQARRRKAPAKKTTAPRKKA
jgi:septal ring factor EnvC (AmiA/AmiB activator)